MRLAALILGLLLSAWAFFEAFAVSLLSANSILADDDEDMAGAAGGGFIAALCGALAAALAIAFPLAATVLFTLAGFIGFLAAGAGYSNHWVYGALYLGLAVMSFFGWRGKRKDQREAMAERQQQRERDARMEALLRQQASQAVQSCPACGHPNPPGSQFCGQCGVRLTSNTAGSGQIST